MGLDLTSDDREALRAFWRFYHPRRASIAERTLTRVKGLSLGLAHLETAAFAEDRWAPFFDAVRAAGARYADERLSYATWLDVLGTYRDVAREDLRVFLDADPAHNRDAMFEIARGLNRYVDLLAGHLAEAYLAAKERVIATGEARYRAMFEGSPQPMWTFDRTTLRFLAVNDAAIQQYGYTRDEFLAMTIADIRPAEDAGAVRSHIGIGLSTGEVWRHRKKDGAMITVEVFASDFTFDGNSTRLVLVTDITERLRAEETVRKTETQLRQSQKMEAIGRLAGGVAHDFNNVLTVVQSYASFLEDTLEPLDARHADATEIRRAAERASTITRQLLTLSRHSIVTPRPVDVDSLIAGLQPMLRRLVGETVVMTMQRGGVPKVVIDPGQLEQVVMNLVVNARDAMPDGGHLVIETRVAAGAFVEIAITDTGHGMDAETQQRIFEPFFSTKPADKGTGLGLAIVHGIVSQAGGTVSAYSEVGHGTTFRVQLPITDAENVAEAPASVDAPRTLPPVRVLVVDDQPAVRAVAARVLKEAGCQVVEASTAQEARKVCAHDEEAIDVALLDVVLPGGGGETLMRQLRELRPAMKFVQMSGYPAGALSVIGASPVDLLAKPFTPPELRAAIARVTGEVPVVAPAAPSAKRRRALVADDDDLMRKVVVRLLQRAAFDVVDVDSGFKAISALESEAFDVVVSDVQMPDGGGLDLLRAVRRVDLDVPVILMTGAPTVAAAAAAVEHGAFRYLTKPLDNAAFVKTVEHAARAHALARLRREAFNVSGMHAGITDRAGLEVRFDQAIEGLWMAFQPIVQASTGALFGVEALMRTSEPSMPHPGAILDAATQLDRLAVLGRRVRGLAGSAIATRSDDIALFVNLHPDDLHDAELVDVAAPLTKLASRVVLEVTERASLDSSPALVERIARLRGLGFRLAVDDIGAGYSGLTSFTELAPEIVKIDMSLVRDVHLSALKQRTIGALCRLCHEVGTLVVGEGVETLEERETLLGLGCDLLQGYLIGKPRQELPG